MKLDIPKHLQSVLRKLLKEGNWAYRRYYCPCGKICNQYDKSGKCLCGLPIADIPIYKRSPVLIGSGETRPNARLDRQERLAE